MTRDCPKEIIEVRRIFDVLDEIVAEGCDVHLEQIGNNTWWLAIYKDGYRQVVWFTKKGVRSEMDDWPDRREDKA